MENKRIMHVELANMCLIENIDGQVLLQLRTKKDWPGFTLPGGHVEKGENLIAAVKREIKEETGLNIANPKLCGVMEYKPKEGFDYYLVFLYKTQTYSGALKDSEEGKLSFKDINDVKSEEWAADMDAILAVYDGKATDIIFKKAADGLWIRVLV